jgi:hypothetical protein
VTPPPLGPGRRCDDVVGGQPVFRETPMLSEALLAMVDLFLFRSPFRTRTDYEARVPAETRAAFERAALAAHALARPQLAAAWKAHLREALEGEGAGVGGSGCEAEGGAGGGAGRDSEPVAPGVVAGGGGPAAAVGPEAESPLELKPLA